MVALEHFQYQHKIPSSNGSRHPDRSKIRKQSIEPLAYGYRIIHPFDLQCSWWPRVILPTLTVSITTCLNLASQVTPHLDYPGRGFAKLRHCETFNPNHLDRSIPSWSTTAPQVLTYTQKPSITGLEIRIVRHQSTGSCLQATMVTSDRRDTYTHIHSRAVLWQKRCYAESRSMRYHISHL